MWKVATTVLAEVDSSLYHWEDKEATRGSLVYWIYVRTVKRPAADVHHGP